MSTQDTNPEEYSADIENKTTPETGNYLVCKGALCKCTFGAAPALLKISNTKYYANDKLVATVNDTDFEIKAPFVACSANPKSYTCIYDASAVNEWTLDGGEEHPVAGGAKVLTTSGHIMCPKKGGKIDIFLHGQIITVPPEIADKVPTSMLLPLNCMIPEDTKVEEKKAITSKVSVSSLSCKTDFEYENEEYQKYNTEIKNNSSVRANTPLHFKATADNEKVNWAIIRKGEGGNQDDQMVYKGLSSDFKISFVKPGTYTVVAFGRDPGTSFRLDKQNNDAKCYREITVSDEKNEILGFEVTSNGNTINTTSYVEKTVTDTGEEVEKCFNMQGYEVWKGESARVNVKLKFVPTPEEIDKIRINVHFYGEPPIEKLAPRQLMLPEPKFTFKGIDGREHTILLQSPQQENTEKKKPEFQYLHEYKYTTGVWVRPVTSTFMHVWAFFDGDEQSKKEMLLLARSNDVVEVKEDGTVLGVNHNKIRPGTTVKFYCTTQEDIGDSAVKITWEVLNGGKLIHKKETDTLKFEYQFTQQGTYEVKAYMKCEAIKNLSRREAVGAPYKDIVVCANTINQITVPATTSVGNTISISASTLFENLADDEKIKWDIALKPQSDQTQSAGGDAEKQKRLQSKKVSFSNTGVDILSPTASTITKSNKDISVKFEKAGTYTITAVINNTKAVSKEVKVEYAEIIDWCFTDSELIKRPEIGWGTKIFVYFQVKGWEGKKVNVNIIYDNRAKTEDHTKRFTKLMTFNAEVGSDGSVHHAIGKGDNLWSELDKFKKSEIAIFFTVSDIETVCDWRDKVYDSPVLGQQIYPFETEGTYTYVDGDTTYSGFFTRNSIDVLTDVVKYNDPVKVSIFRNNNKSYKAENYHYKLYLIENLPGKDKIISEEKVSFDDEGKINLNIESLIKSEDHDSSKPHIPRFFYFHLKRDKIDKDKFNTLALEYPKDYSQDKKNDDFIIELANSGVTSAEITALREALGTAYNSISFNRNYGIYNICTQDDLVSSQSQEELDAAVAESNNKAKTDNEKLLTNNVNYYRQLKVALKPDIQNRSIHNVPQPVIIGAPVVVEKRKIKCICREHNLIWSSQVNCAFRKKVIRICADLWGESRKIEMANGLMAVMAAETGRTFKAHRIEGVPLKNKSEVIVTDFQKWSPDPDNPGKKKRSSRAVGLIQFTQSPLEDLGKFKRGSGFDKLDAVKLEFAQMSELEQLDWVKKYFQIRNAASKIKMPEDIYSQVFAPALVGKPLDAAIFSEGSEEYSVNASIDTDGNNDGKIQKRELIKRYYDLYNEGLGERSISICEDPNVEGSTDWHDPIDDPQINKYNYSGYEKPQSATFGNVRMRSDGSQKYHSGLDLFGIPGETKVYTCLDSKLISAKDAGGLNGYIIVLDILNTKDLITQMEKVSYERQFSPNEFLAGRSLGNGNGEKVDYTLKETDTVEVCYVHLDYSAGKIVLTKDKLEEIKNNGNIIKAGTHIGYSGVTGNADKTKAPHLHIGMKVKGTKTQLNPALFIKLNSYNNKKQDDANKTWEKKAKDTNNLP